MRSSIDMPPGPRERSDRPAIPRPTFGRAEVLRMRNKIAVFKPRTIVNGAVDGTGRMCKP